MSSRAIDIKLPKTVSTHPPELVGTKKCSGDPVGDKGADGSFCVGKPGEYSFLSTTYFKPNKIVKRMPRNVFNWIKYKNADGTINWDKLGFADDIKPDRKDAFVSAAQLMYDYITKNNVVTQVGEINFECVVFPIIRKVIENSNNNLEDPEKFYNYCIEFARNALPHYRNVIEKLKRERNDEPRPCIDIEAQLASDLSDNILKILKSNE